jgi:iron complex outermembrane recepter protein
VSAEFDFRGVSSIGAASWRTPAALAAALFVAGASPAWAIAPTPEELSRLSIEELANIDVSSVSKTSQPLSDAPAAIYVITHEDAVRSGATNLAEILRLAPNLQVARVTANSFAVSARGFNGTAADKLLVLIDGRSVYTAFSHGVLWDAQDVPAEIIDRVEVISGPGATLWGANAVNGVINVVTRRASADPGGALQIGVGDRTRRAALQYAGALGEQVAWRAYASGIDYEQSVTAAGANAEDAWNKWQGGFRLDWTPGTDLITLQGDGYHGVEDQPTTSDQKIVGYNLMARWTRPVGAGVLQAQAFYDYLERRIDPTTAWLRTYDLDLQHSFTLGSSHQVVWGGGYRVTEDYFPIVPVPGILQAFRPIGRTLHFYNVFAQDTVALTPDLKLTLGLKLEHDPYSGMEYLPSARVSWKLSPDDLLWAAASRAVRQPSRLDRDFVQFTGAALVLTGRDFQPEKLTAYEVGYRAQPSERSSVSISAYYNVYDDLRSFELTGGRFPLVFANEMEGETYGVEAWGAYQVADWWRLSAGANWMHKDLRFKPGSSRVGGIQIAGDDPAHQLSLRSEMQLGSKFRLDLDLRHVDDLPAPASPAYAELGARLRWAVNDTVEMVLTGSNLLHRRHLEFGSTGAAFQLGASGVETSRSVFLDTRWRF